VAKPCRKSYREANVRAAKLPAAFAAAALLACACSKDPTSELLQPSSGGATTVSDSSRNAYSLPAANLDVSRRAEFFIGNAFFNSPWVAAPATASARDGLGPLFNARSCDTCHANDGRGQPPTKPAERPIALVVQFATTTPGKNHEPQGDPRYGANLNPFAVGSVPPEGTVRITHREISGRYADGEIFTLAEPQYAFEELAYGELAPETRFSPRVAPAVFGAGLLEAVAESQILEWSDPDDANGDGISGRPNYVWNSREQRRVLGRFGWKANQPDVAHQTAAAFSSEMGMSTSLRSGQNCTSVQTACLEAPDGGEPEISDEIFERIVAYERMLAVPTRRELDSPQVREGARLFLEAGCASCHRPTLKTGRNENEPWLSEQTIHPFTDLLLHDMGEALADGRPDFEASGREWRTPPLWGIGLQQTVNGHTRLLHDGRARNLAEAILWHGGEAERAKEAFRTMSKEDREALLAFLNSL
jgi:CxxC motif-containing protein (DUF1111 family)